MSATGFHPEPSANAPWTRTIVLTAAYAGDDAAKAAPVRRARIKRFMLQLHKIAPLLPPPGRRPRRPRLREITAGNYGKRNGCKVRFAQQQSRDAHVRLGSKVDI